MFTPLDLLAVAEIPPGNETETITAIVVAVICFLGLWIFMGRARAARTEKRAATFTPLGYTFRAQAAPEDEHLLDGFVQGELYARGRRKRLHNIARAPAARAARSRFSISISGRMWSPQSRSRAKALSSEWRCAVRTRRSARPFSS